VIVYEHPLSERVRTLLRLEHLFERTEYFQGRNDGPEHHAALLLIFEILEVASRADLKSDLLQELERQKQTLDALRDNPDISEEALDNVLWQIDQASSRLFQASGKVGQELRENDWLMSMWLRLALLPLLAAAKCGYPAP
jgi:cell division protein ZapD